MSWLGDKFFAATDYLGDKLFDSGYYDAVADNNAVQDMANAGDLINAHNGNAIRGYAAGIIPVIKGSVHVSELAREGAVDNTAPIINGIADSLHTDISDQRHILKPGQKDPHPYFNIAADGGGEGDRALRNGDLVGAATDVVKTIGKETLQAGKDIKDAVIPHLPSWADIWAFTKEHLLGAGIGGLTGSFLGSYLGSFGAVLGLIGGVAGGLYIQDKFNQVAKDGHHPPLMQVLENPLVLAGMSGPSP